MYVIGIDPGTKTGLAIYDKVSKQLTVVCTLKVHEAFDVVKKVSETARQHNVKMFVRVEDARKRKRYGPNSNAKQQGAGAIKIQCKQWEEFLLSEGISFDLVAPAQIKTKVDAKKFKMITGWSARTSNHGRDAAMLVYGL
ncbi:hypothetical protein [Pedobacter cryoconitis]|uniref:hypothetical protein n=1 Tax=Pedobacter cryoconitis TaxID=188932 RepID=UPI0012FC6FA6|nr:hypothetical protein [Pedobacter cryoconitis]